MADTKTFGVKVPEELHQEAAELQKKLGLTGEGFLQELIAAFKTEKMKERTPEVAEDLRELQILTRRMDNIYLNLAQRIENINKMKEEEKIELISKKESIIYELQSKIEGVKADYDGLIDAYNNVVNLNNDLNKRVNELTNMYNDNKALVEEYKSKNDMLTGMLKKYEKYPEQVEEYKNLLTDAQSRNIELKNDLSAKEEENKRLSKQIQQNEKDFADRIDGLVARQKEKIEDLKQQEEFKKDKALLEQDKIHQTEINKINEANNEKIKELLTINQEYNQRITKLLEENQEKNSKINELVNNLSEVNLEKNKVKTK